MQQNEKKAAPAEVAALITQKAKPRYTLADLLAASNYLDPSPPEEREWIDARPAVAELLP